MPTATIRFRLSEGASLADVATGATPGSGGSAGPSAPDEHGFVTISTPDGESHDAWFKF